MHMVLMRRQLGDVYRGEQEWDIASAHFRTVSLRTHCHNATVIGRYACLPYYRELEKDLDNLGCTLINDSEQHEWVANFDWYDALEAYTPKTWDDNSFSRCNYDGPFVVKGRTNSRKERWNDAMFASDHIRASVVAAQLMSDPEIGPQGVVYREYVPLKTYEHLCYGLPVTNEWRFFFYKTEMLSVGYYWSNASEDVISGRTLSSECVKLARHIAAITSQHVTFFTLDLAETKDGDWILIEVNDGQQSGLSENNPHTLYSNLREALEL